MDSTLNIQWNSLTLIEQMINIGNEVKRAVRCDSNRIQKNSFLSRAIQYTEYTINDPKNQNVIPELEIGKEVLLDYRGDHKLNCTKEQINKYYQNFLNFLGESKCSP